MRVTRLSRLLTWLHRSTAVYAVVGLACLASSANAATTTIVVSEFQVMPANPAATVPGAWYLSDMRGGGTATVANLAGLGGNLENNAPLPDDAARLTTGGSSLDKAEVATFGNFGSATSFLANLEMVYSYYKANAGAPAAAPSLKIAIFNPTGSGTGNADSYGQLVYEPYMNKAGSPPIGNPPTGVWQTVLLDENSGSGVTSSGGWWWTGGFGLASSAGGPPYRSAAEWLAAFQAGTDAADFAGAYISAISVGVGSNNLNQIGYFDNVSYTVGGNTTTFDFEIATVPEPSSLAIGSVLIMLVGGVSRFRNRKANSPTV